MGSSIVKDEVKATGEKTHKFMHELHKVEKKTCGACGLGCCKCIAILLCVLVVLIGIIEIAACVTTAIATKLFSSDLSGRLVSLIILAVTAAVALSVSVYAVAGMFRKKKKALHVAGTVLVIMCIVQGLICGLAVKMSARDQSTLAESLKESFKLALTGNPKHVKIWSIASSDLKCCGLYGPDDYRDPRMPPSYPPEVPVSCCLGYNSSKSDILQEATREMCKANRTYYDVGCGRLITNVFSTSAGAVLAVTIVLIVAEVVLAVQVFVMYILYKKRHDGHECCEETAQNKTSEPGPAHPEHSHS